MLQVNIFMIIDKDKMKIGDRSWFNLWYQFGCQPQTRCWIQIPKVGATVMYNQGNMPYYAGFYYQKSDGSEYIEFCVDDCMSFLRLVNK